MKEKLKLQRRHFEFIADVIKEAKEQDYYFIEEMFVMRLKATNPLFDKNKFLKRCGQPFLG